MTNNEYLINREERWMVYTIENGYKKNVKEYISLVENIKKKWCKEWQQHLTKCNKPFREWTEKRIELVGTMQVYTLDYNISREIGINISSGYDNDILWAEYERRMDEEIKILLRKQKIEKIKNGIEELKKEVTK